MYRIDYETLNICLSYANTFAQEFALVPNEEGLEINPETDKIFVSIKDEEDKEVFCNLYDIAEEVTNDGKAFIFTFMLNYSQSKRILPGNYTWDFTYFQNILIENNRPAGGSMVYTPFCHRAKAVFLVQDTNSTDEEE